MACTGGVNAMRNQSPAYYAAASLPGVAKPAVLYKYGNLGWRLHRLIWRGSGSRRREIQTETILYRKYRYDYRTNAM